MRAAAGAVVFACLAALGWALAPLAAPPPSQQLVAGGVQAVRPVDFEVIDRVLQKRAPGLGLKLREQLSLAISQEAQRAAYDPLLILALIDVESDFQDHAISNMGARGLMQIRPTTLYFLAEKEGLRLSREEVERDPTLSVRLGVRYLRSLHNRFNNLDLALMAYNAGPNRLREAAKQRQLDRFRGYVKAVQREYGLLRLQHGLGTDWALAQSSQSAPAARLDD